MTKHEINQTDTEDDIHQDKLYIKIIKVIVKLIIAFMLYACWSNHLPDYFNTMLLASFVGAAWVTYKELQANNFITMIFSLTGTIFLNPLYPLYFNAGMQYTVYLILVIGFSASAIFDLFKPRPNHEKTNFNE